MIFCCYLITSIAGASCTKAIEAKRGKFVTIPAGKHSPAGIYFNTDRAGTRSYYLAFDSSAIYYHQDTTYQDSWNKLPGIVINLALCIPPHHNTAYLYAWRWYDDQLQIGTYRHVKCDDPYQANYIATIDIGVIYLFQITSTAGDRIRYRILRQNMDIVADTTYFLNRQFKTRNMKYYTYFWYGGIYPAPHDITFYFSEL